jgi:biotin-(acetyl-CoA carboxylase) ligase
LQKQQEKGRGKLGEEYTKEKQNELDKSYMWEENY